MSQPSVRRISSSASSKFSSGSQICSPPPKPPFAPPALPRTSNRQQRARLVCVGVLQLSQSVGVCKIEPGHAQTVAALRTSRGPNTVKARQGVPPSDALRKCPGLRLIFDTELSRKACVDGGREILNDLLCIWRPSKPCFSDSYFCV
jgi:hypothetical protein